MPAHKTNGILKFAVIPVVIIVFIGMVMLVGHHDKQSSETKASETNKNSAAQDSAAESLNTLTAQLAATQQQVKSVTDENTKFKSQNQLLQQKLQGKNAQENTKIAQEVADLKNQVQALNNHSAPITAENTAQPITTVPELEDTLLDPKTLSAKKAQKTATTAEDKKPMPVPFYTIPANATSVQDRLMTPLVGRIPVKGVVTDPYPFKLVIADNTLAANGLRVPNLKQMIVSGYTEGDLNLVSTRGWVTSLTFVFADGTISTTTSNDNNIGHFTKENALGYLSDERGNPAIRGKLITNAPTYLGINVALGAAEGAANAYAQAQTTNQGTTVGTSTTTVTGSQGAFVAGQAMGNAASQVQQWWHDREENSFDAVFVPTVKETNEPQMIVVNFTKEIHIDYDPQGRKINYAHALNVNTTRNLD